MDDGTLSDDEDEDEEDDGTGAGEDVIGNERLGVLWAPLVSRVFEGMAAVAAAAGDEELTRLVVGVVVVGVCLLGVDVAVVVVARFGVNDADERIDGDDVDDDDDGVER